MNAVEARLALDHKARELWDVVISRQWSTNYIPASAFNGFHVERTVPLPDALLDTYRQAECAMFTGLLPEINRAWVSIDDRLFLWNYEDGRDFCVYDGVDQVIVSVGLVRAKPHLFVDEVKYLLLVATPVEVIALAVSFAQDIVNGELTLHPTGLSVPSDNVHMMCIAGTQDGRAFMGGADGCLYELNYAADDSWLATRPMKCRKLNRSSTVLGALVPSFLKYLIHASNDPIRQIAIDSSRGILYTLSEGSRLEVRLIGENAAVLASGSPSSSENRGSTAPCIAWMEANHWRQQLAEICPRASDQDMNIVSIHIIPLSESGHVHLVAATARGTRLYFTTHRVESYTASDDGDHKPPKTLRLLHARLPPPSADAHDKDGCRAAFATAAGVALAIPRGQDMDSVCVAGMLIPGDQSSNGTDMAVDATNTPRGAVSSNSSTLRECHQSVYVDGTVLAMAEIPRPPLADPYLVSDNVRYSAATRMMFADAPTGIQLGSALTRHVHATAHLQPPRRLLCFTGTGVVVLARKSPADALHDLLNRSRGEQYQELLDFFNFYGAVEVCAMCFMLATCPPPSGASADIGIRHAGTPPSLLQHVGPIANTRPPNANLVQYATAALNRYGGVPTVRQRNSATQTEQTVGRAVLEAQFNHSATHDGLALYLSRLLRPVWQYNIAVQETHIARPSSSSWGGLLSDEDLFQIRSRIDTGGLERVERPLRALSALLDKTPHLTPQLVGRGRTTAARKEAESLTALRALLEGSLHALAFWRTLCDNNFSEIAARLSDEDSTRLLATTFQDLVDKRPKFTVDSNGTDRPRDAEVVDGTAMARVLLNELIAKHSESGQSVEFLSSQLRARCPTLFVEGDRTRFAAHELLQGARSVTNVHEREELLDKAVERFCSVAGTVNVATVCRSLTGMQCYDGALDVVLAHTEAIDPQGRALRYHIETGSSSGDYLTRNTAEPQTPGGAMGTTHHTDIQSAALHKRSLEAYACIFDALDELLLARDNEPDRALAQKHQAAFEALKRRAVASNDQLFHICLYDWMLRPGSNGRASLESELLNLNTPYLEAYLKATSIDLLCRFYVRVGKLDAAALILSKLAEQRGELTLEARIANLSRAKGCLAQNVGPVNAQLRDIPDKLDVARLQMRVRRWIELRTQANTEEEQTNPQQTNNQNDQTIPFEEARRAIRDLNDQLFNMTELFNKYAKKYRMWDLQLAIIHSSGHTDAALARRIWHHLIREYAATDSNSVLAGKIVELGREYYPSDITFPLSTIVLLLERVSLARIAAKVSNGSLLWVAHALHSGGAAWPALFAVYDALIERAESDASFAAEEGLRLQLLRVVQQLLDEWLANEPNAQRLIREYRISESVDKYIVALSSIPPVVMRAVGLSQVQVDLVANRLRTFL